MWGAAPRTGRVSTLLTLLAFLALSVVANAGATIGPSTSSDFNGDGRSDVAVWRPSNGTWYIDNVGTPVWGTAGDVPVASDYNGDGKADVGVFRRSNATWYIRNIATISWGRSGDVPVPGDYNGDGKTDVAVFRPSNGTWYVRTNTHKTVTWGAAGDIPVPGDYNGDGKTDIAVFRPSNATWYIRNVGTIAWGASGDVPVAADYNGDHTTDIAVWRPSNGTWYVRNGDTVQWGSPGDVPVPADYNGDHSADFAVWRPSNGTWYLRNIDTVAWGNVGDLPSEGPISMDTAPPAPVTGVRATGTTTSSVAVAWSPTSDNVGVAGYNVYRDGKLVGSTAGLAFTFSGIACGTSSTFAVEAFDAAGNMSDRSLSTLTQSTDPCPPPDTTAPSSPTNLRITNKTQTALTLSWDAASDNVGVTGYTAYLDSTQTATTTSLSATFANLPCNTTHTLAVEARDAAGNVSSRASISDTTGACPTTGGGSAPPVRFMINSDQGNQAAANYGYNLLDVGSVASADALPAGTRGLIWLGDYDNSTCTWEQSDATVRSIAQAAVGDSKVYGYFISDEPDPYACPTAYADHKARSDFIHSIDPGHKTLILIDSNSGQQTLDQIPHWAGAADAFALDPYPCYQGSPCNYTWIDQVITAANGAGINYWGVVQAFQDSTWRWPTTDELNHMLGQWAASSETGMMTFAWTWNGNAITSQPALLAALQTFNSGGTTTTTDTTAPSIPTNLKVTGATSNSISVSWTPSTDNVGVTGYGLYKNNTLASSTTASSATFGSLACNTSVTLSVDATDAAGNRSGKATITASTAACPVDATPPSTPTNLRLSNTTQTALAVAWDASTDNVGVTAYNAYLDGTLTATTTSLAATFSGLTCGTTHVIGVEAKDAAGNVSGRASLSATTGACSTGGGGSGTAPPERFMIDSDQGNQAAANYGYNLLDVGSAAEADALPAGTQGLIWVGDYNNSTCTWEQSDATVRTTVQAGVGDPKVWGYYISDEPDPYACPTTYADHKARSNFIHSIDPGHKTLILIDSNSAQQTIDQIPHWAGTADVFALDPYPCYQGQTCNYNWIDQVIAAANSAGINYWGVVQAFQDSIWRWPTTDELTHMLGQWAASRETGIMTFAWTWAGNTLSSKPDLLSVLQTFNAGGTTTPPPADTTAPTTPTNLTVTGATSSSISISWTASSDNVGVTAYGLYKNGTLATTTTSTNATFSGLPCNTSVTLAVDATDAAGNRSGKATLTAPTAACPSDTIPPSTPSNLAVTSTTSSSISISWAASTDNVGVTGYGLYTNGALTGSTTATSATFSGLPCNTSVALAVDAADAAGNRSGKATLTASTAACPTDTTPPTTPTNLHVTTTAQTALTVAWTASTDNVGVTGYNTYLDGTLTGTTTSLSATFSSLACNTSHSLAVAAKDAAGNISGKATVTASTAACSDTTPPSTPTGLAQSSNTQTSVALSWTASTDNVGVTGYNIYRGGTLDGTSTTTTYTSNGLTCGGSYSFTVQAKDAAGNVSPQSSAATGTTAACSTGGSDPTIVAAGDICGSATDCTPTADLIGQINPTRVLTLGDNAYDAGTLSEYQTEYDPNWGKYNAKVSPAPGNHEYDTSGGAGYFAYFGSIVPAPYYSYDVGTWHLISLNAEVSVSSGSAEETWLRNDLAAHSNQCTLAYWHEPRFSSGTTHGSDTDLSTVWDDLYNAHADVVLNGHEHNYERFAKQNPSGVADPNGIREFIAGTGGASHGYPFGTPLATSEVRNDSTWGVLKLTLHPTGYDWQFVPIAGSTFTDSGSDTCRA